MSEIQWRDADVSEFPQAQGQFEAISEGHLGGALYAMLGVAVETEHPETHEMVKPVMMTYMVHSPLGAVKVKEGMLAVDISMDAAKQMIQENWDGIPDEKKEGLMNPNPISLMMMAIQQAGGGNPLGEGPAETDDDDPSQYTREA
jgi:hypothetical protein